MQTSGQSSGNPPDGEKDEFHSRIMRLVEENRKAADALISGSVQLLGVENLKSKYGDQWQDVRGRVATMIENIVLKHISQGDIFIDAGQDRYVILFMKLGERQGHAKAAEIGREIDRRLAGDEAGQEITIETIAVDLPRDNPEEFANAKSLQNLVKGRADQKKQSLQDVIEQRLAETHYEYWPVLDVEARLVSAYLVRPALPDDKQFRDAYRLASGPVQVSGHALKRALSDLSDIAADAECANLVIEINYRDLVNERYRAQLMDVLRDAPQSSSSFLFIEITGIPDDVLQTAMNTTLGYFGPFVAGFICRFSEDFRRFSEIKSGSIKGFGIEGNWLDPEDKQMSAIFHRFAEAATGLNAAPYILEIGNDRAGTHAKNLGFKFMQGPGVAPAFRQLGPVFKI